MQAPDNSKGGLLVCFPTRPELADVCVKHHLSVTRVCASAQTDGWTAASGERDKWNKYNRTGKGVSKPVPLLRAKYERVGPAALRFLDRVAKVLATS